MRINSGGSQDINVLQSDSVTFRNNDKDTIDGIAYAGGQNMGPTTGNKSNIQLFNKAGSGKTILIDQIYVTATVDSAFYLTGYDTQLTDDLGDWRQKIDIAQLGSGEIRTESSSGLLGTPWNIFYVAGNIATIISYKTPFGLNPGSGIVVASASNNVIISANFEGREV